jgi:cytoskeletal protein CcmA (bactofilin family)
VFLDASGNATLGADLSVGDDLTILGGLIDLKSNSGSPSQIKFYCESSNAHAQTLTAQAHSVGATNTLTLPAGSNSTLVSESHTQTLTNKSLTAPTITGTAVMADLDISGDVDVDGTLEADAVTVNGTALNTVIAGVTVTNATNSAHVLVTDNESTDEENLITFVEDATSSTGNVGLEMDGNLTYNPSSGTVTATVFKGNIDAVDGDFDGTLEADAITLNGTAVTTTATLSTGISNGNVLVATSGIADNDFLRVDGTSIEGRSASEVLSDIGATTASAAADEATALAIALG